MCPLTYEREKPRPDIDIFNTFAQHRLLFYHIIHFDKSGLRRVISFD